MDRSWRVLPSDHTFHPWLVYPDPVIEISHLTKTYGSFVAVDDLSLSIPAGEVFGFLGPNGAGKTTTIRILAGLSLPTRGEVRIGAFDAIRQARDARRITGYVPDRPWVYEKLTAWELLRFVSDLYEVPWSKSGPIAEHYISWFELDDWAGTRVENYSHGMKQKLVIITSLIHEPDVLIIDEPMVGLDAFAQRQVRQLMREQAALGRTIFLTTHTLSTAEAVCDRVGILHRGRIVALGSPTELNALAGQDDRLEDVFLKMTTEEVV